MTAEPLDPDLVAMARLALANGHGDLGTPESQANLRRAQLLASSVSCDHCEVQCALTPVAAGRWLAEQAHDPDCPLHDDQTPGLHTLTR